MRVSDLSTRRPFLSCSPLEEEVEATILAAEYSDRADGSTFQTKGSTMPRLSAEAR